MLSLTGPAAPGELAAWIMEPGGTLWLLRHSSTGRLQQLLIPADQRARLRAALDTLAAFEANPDDPKWKTRGYVTKAEAEALADAHPEWFPDPERPPDEPQAT
jgi:hypothetical protein